MDNPIPLGSSLSPNVITGTRNGVIGINCGGSKVHCKNMNGGVKGRQLMWLERRGPCSVAGVTSYLHWHTGRKIIRGLYMYLHW